MDYKEKYETAIKQAKEELKACGDLDCDAVRQIFRFFPELAESKDEDGRIRKALKEYFINSFQINGVAAICGVHIKDILAWLEKQGESYTKRDVDDAYIKGICDAKHELEKQGEQINYNEELKKCKENPLYFYDKHCKIKIKEHNPHWSEEDEAVLDALTRRLEGEDIYVSPHLAVKCLKSLKDRVQPQPQPEWSEEDIEIRKDIVDRLERLRMVTTGSEKELCKDISWLKSLRPQINVTDEELAQAKKEAYNDTLDKIEYHSGEPTFDDGWGAAIWYLKKRNVQPQSHWKPSDEQMDALRYVTNFDYGGHKTTLVSLYEQLKKLREE